VITGKRAATKERNTTALVAAARRLFTEHGYQGVGIETIAAEAGLTTGAIYSLFGAKHGLLLAVLADTQGRIEAALRDDPAASASDVVSAYARAYHDFVITPGGWRTLRLEAESLALMMHEEAVRERVTELDEARTERLAGLLEGRLVGSRRLDMAESRRTALALSVLLQGLSRQHAVQPHATDAGFWTDTALALLG